MRKCVDGVFQDEQGLVVDRNWYERCRFEKCRLIYRGGGLPVLRDCQVSNCEWVLEGPAYNTLCFLNLLFRTGSRQAVERMFERITEAEG
jgi:hypothetical protein